MTETVTSASSAARSAPSTPAAPPVDRNDRRRRRTREALLHAASEIFQERGVDGATVADIAGRADVAHGSLYNHFSGIDEIVGVLARESVQRILDRTQEIMSEVSDPQLLPCVGARVILRTFVQDAVVTWMVKRPFVFTSTFEAEARPFMLRVETPGVAGGVLKPAAGHEVWMRTLPWILLSELTRALSDAPGNASEHEESFARICMRLLGVEDSHADHLLELSLRLVTEHGY
jgi:AcrR family transcriptional regulator